MSLILWTSLNKITLVLHTRMTVESRYNLISSATITLTFDFNFQRWLNPLKTIKKQLKCECTLRLNKLIVFFFSTLFRPQLLAGVKSKILRLQPSQTARRIYTIPILFTNKERHISKQVTITNPVNCFIDMPIYCRLPCSFEEAAILSSYILQSKLFKYIKIQFIYQTSQLGGSN